MQDDSLCGIVGCDINQGENYLLNLDNIVQTGLTVLFSLIIIYGIFMIIKAVVKIISSEGDEGKLESGLKSIRGVYYGVVIIFVGLIGLVIIFALFNVTELPDNVDLPGGDGGVITDPFN